MVKFLLYKFEEKSSDPRNTCNSEWGLWAALIPALGGGDGISRLKKSYFDLWDLLRNLPH